MDLSRICVCFLTQESRFHFKALTSMLAYHCVSGALLYWSVNSQQMKRELTKGSSLCDSKFLSRLECKAPEFSCKIDTQILDTSACCCVLPFKWYCANSSRPFVTQGESPQLSLSYIWPTARNIRSCADLSLVLSRPIQFHGARTAPKAKILTLRVNQMSNIIIFG